MACMAHAAARHRIATVDLAHALQPAKSRSYAFDALALFTIAVVVVTLGDKSSPLTIACGWAYLAARILYVPAYAFGWQPWRSLIWSVGLLATTVMLVAALL